jgi:magnesium-transporting ATPase (P-type)
MNKPDYCRTFNYIDSPSTAGIQHFELNIHSGFVNTGTWILIFTNFVPISLVVALETVCFIQGTMMTQDLHMY